MNRAVLILKSDKFFFQIKQSQKKSLVCFH